MLVTSIAHGNMLKNKTKQNKTEKKQQQQQKKNKNDVILQLQENHLIRFIFCIVITFVFSMKTGFVKIDQSYSI